MCSPVFPKRRRMILLLLCPKRGLQLVIGKAQIFAAGSFRQQFRIIIGIVKQPLLHFFPFCHGIFSFLSMAVQYMPHR